MKIVVMLGIAVALTALFSLVGEYAVAGLLSEDSVAYGFFATIVAASLVIGYFAAGQIVQPRQPPR